MSEAVTAMVVDDHPVWRDGVRTSLESAGITVVGEAADGGEAIDVAREKMPDVVLMDLRLPVVAGVEATRQIVAESPHVKILVLSMSGAESDVIEAVKAGANGYLLKSAEPDEIADAVRRVSSGEPVFTPELAGLVLHEFRRVAQPSVGEPTLTPRENEVIRFVARGYTYPEIAKELFISTKTVQNHVQNILTKFQLRGRWELMAYLIRKGYDRAPDPEPPTGD